MTIGELTGIDHFNTVIQQSTAPAFVLTAVAGFISVTTNKLHRLVDRIREIEALDPELPRAAELAPELPLLRRRARLLHDAIRLSLVSAVCTTVIIVAAFLAAFLGWRHEYGMAVLFCMALVLLALAVVNVFREVHAGDFEFDETVRPRG
ncbi:MAG: DUF2721 domain-containing protein [Alsobacter sp.]